MLREIPDTDRYTTSIVLPAYNEAGNLGPLVAELLETIKSAEMAPYRPAEMVIVDDGSTDDSRKKLRSLASEHDALTVLFLAQNFGQSAALAAGIDNATGEYIITMDADRQNDPADIPALLGDLDSGYDCVSGWRKEREDPLAKTVPSRIQTYLARLTGPDIHDFGCTLKAYRAAALCEVNLYGEGHRYIPAKLHKRGYAMTERAVGHRPRTEGSTKYGWRRLLKGFMDLLFHIFWNRYSTRPLHFLGSVGILLMSAGGLIGLHAVLIKYIQGASLVPKLPRLILVTAMVLFGLQLVMFGFLAEMVSKTHYEDRDPYRIGTIVTGDKPIDPPRTSRGIGPANTVDSRSADEAATDRPSDDINPSNE
jgi:glycosyltransferase involved in cell wall biosynthesis